MNQNLTNEVLPDTARGNKLVNLARDLQYILISICQGPAATVDKTATQPMVAKHYDF